MYRTQRGVSTVKYDLECHIKRSTVDVDKKTNLLEQWHLRMNKVPKTKLSKRSLHEVP
jgi:hypothetical protein